MEFKKIIFPMTGFLFLMSAIAALAWIPHSSNIPAERIRNPHPFNWNWSSMVVAENEPKETESGNVSTNESRGSKSDSKREKNEKSDQNGDNAATKPLKPFKPSEEIAAEQAVDFPVDI